jgi:hypothetical protein
MAEGQIMLMETFFQKGLRDETTAIREARGERQHDVKPGATVL